jgi:hypothetical protein
LSGAGAGSAALKKFLALPDRESIQDLHNPETLAQFDEETKGSTIQVCGEPFKVYLRENLWHGKGILDGEKHHFTGQSREQVIGKLVRLSQGHGETSVRALTEAQLLEVSRIASTGNRPAAINRYLTYCIPEALADKYETERQLISDTTLRPLMDEICEFVWLNSRLDATDSVEWQQFKASFIGSRPYSGALLDHAWQDFSNQRNRVLPMPLEPEPEEPAVEELNDLDDADINKLFWDTAKHAVRGR